MKNAYIKGKAQNFKKICINYIVWEKFDDGLLLECDVVKGNNRSYKSNFCIDFKELNGLINRICKKVESSNFYELINEHLLSNGNTICELDLEKHMGAGIQLEDFSFTNTYHELRA